MDRGSFFFIKKTYLFIYLLINKILDKDRSCSNLISFGKVWHKPVENLTWIFYRYRCFRIISPYIQTKIFTPFSCRLNGFYHGTSIVYIKMKLSFCNNLCTEHNDLAVNCSSVYFFFQQEDKKPKEKLQLRVTLSQKLIVKKKFLTVKKLWGHGM